jgi:hypothetical protein
MSMLTLRRMGWFSGRQVSKTYKVTGGRFVRGFAAVCILAASSTDYVAPGEQADPNVLCA